MPGCSSAHLSLLGLFWACRLPEVFTAFAILALFPVPPRHLLLELPLSSPAVFAVSCHVTVVPVALLILGDNFRCSGESLRHFPHAGEEIPYVMIYERCHLKYFLNCASCDSGRSVHLKHVSGELVGTETGGSLKQEEVCTGFVLC